MPLDENGVPCERVIEWEVVGTKKVPVGTKKVKVGRKFQEIVIYGEEPIRKRVTKLIPATKRGWRRTVTFELPEIDAATKTINIVRYTHRAVSYNCSMCNSNEHVMLKLMGWSYSDQRHLAHKGNGVVWRCFKCDVTVGPVDHAAKATREIVKTGATKKEAREVVYKYGLDFDMSLLE